MFRLWAKAVKNNKIISDLIVENDSADLSRTKKIFVAIETVCNKLDLSVPMWLESNISEFRRTAKTRFTADNFFDHIDLDYLEVSVIEEDRL